MEDFIHLVHSAQSGSLEAFTMLVTRFQNMAYGYAYAILGDFDLAQDAAQEAFIDAYQVFTDLREPVAFPAWLKRIIFKYCDRLSRQKRHETFPLDTIIDSACPEPGPQEMIERSELSIQVQKAIQAIPTNLRMVTVLFYLGGYSHAEIADFLEVPTRTVKSRLHASRQRLKERMLAMVQDGIWEEPTSRTIYTGYGR